MNQVIPDGTHPNGHKPLTGDNDDGEDDRDFALHATGLRAGYGAVPVIEDVSIAVRPGEFVGLLGANGAGKTTLMMALAGFLRPWAGEIQMFGESAPSRPHIRARKGLMFIGDDRHVLPSLTVRQNMRLVGCDAQESMTGFPELSALWHRRAGLLSGGEQQMLALARCMATKPKIVLVDEVALGLAPKVADRLMLLLKDLALEGAAVMVVDQNARAVLDVADRIYILRSGRIRVSAPASEWKDRIDDLASFYLS